MSQKNRELGDKEYMFSFAGPIGRVYLGTVAVGDGAQDSASETRKELGMK